MISNDGVAPQVEVEGDAGLVNAPTLEVRGLSGGYGDLRILTDISLEVRPNEVVSVLGANGAGKTTLLRNIAGALPSWSGSVLLNGSPVDSLSAYKRARQGIGHVPSGRELFPELSVEDNIMLGSLYVSKDRSILLRDQVLDLFPAVAKLLRRRAGTLSGGEQQMVAIGRALMTDPKLLLLDEPSTGLAPKIVGNLFEALQRLSADMSLATVVVEQNVSLALSLAARAYVLENGSFSISGYSEDLKKDDSVVQAYLPGSRAL